MDKYRLRYARFGPARFASHLDLGRALGRALRRAALPVAYSQGFHPLPKMAFGPPLPVGVESEAEFLELTLTRELAPEEIAGHCFTGGLGGHGRAAAAAQDPIVNELD